MKKVKCSICNEIYDSLKNDLGVNLPDKKSRWAGVGERFRYFHLWFLQGNYWDNWGMSYRIWFFEDHPTYDNNVVIRFEINRKHLLSKGIDESNLHVLEEYLKSWNGKEEFKFFDKNAVCGIEKIIPKDRNLISETIKFLIKSTLDKINEIFKE